MIRIVINTVCNQYSMQAAFDKSPIGAPTYNQFVCAVPVHRPHACGKYNRASDFPHTRCVCTTVRPRKMRVPVRPRDDGEAPEDKAGAGAGPGAAAGGGGMMFIDIV